MDAVLAALEAIENQGAFSTDSVFPISVRDAVM